MYTRLERPVVCAGAHRSGWPWVMSQLEELFTNSGPVLDDFTDATYTYRRVPGYEATKPWVGIFHHPVTIESPLGMDKGFALRRLDNVEAFVRAKETLCGAFAFSSEVAADLHDWLDVPVKLVKHPSDTNVPQWHGGRRLFQVGFFLRNTRAIFQIPYVSGWDYHRSTPKGLTAWLGKRDEALKRYYYHRRRPIPKRVTEHGREDEASYDELLATSVVLTEIYSASANNVVLECMARCTPILVNKLKAVEEYLGSDYPLYFKDLKHAARLLADERAVAAAHDYLSRLDKRWMDGAYFAESLRWT